MDPCPGLVFGFHFREGASQVVTQQTLSAACDAGHDWVWLHLALSDHRTQRFIEALEAAPVEVHALLKASEDRIQLHLTANGAFGILPDIERDFADHSLGSGRFGFWLDGRQLITTRRHPLQGADLLRSEIDAGVLPQSPAAALARLVEHFVALVEKRLMTLQAELGRIEDEVLAERFTDNRRLGALRRELSRYAREFSGLRSAVHRALSGRHGGALTSPLLEHLPPLMQDVEDFDRDAAGLADRARLIYEEIETRIASTTNRSLSALTVISTLLLPPTFIAGLFGMNVAGLPWMQDKNGFWAVLALCGLLFVAMWMLLKRFRVLA